MIKNSFRLILAFVLLFSATLYAQADQILLCGKDISQQSSPFKWQHVQDKAPLYLYPNDAEKIYQQLLNEYISHLNQSDTDRDQVTQFIELQREIIAGKKSAFLSLKAGPFGGDSLVARDIKQGRDVKIFDIPCEDIEQAWLIDIAYLTFSYRKIHDASFEIFRQQADKTIQKRNLQYQNWFDNGLAMWPQETWFNGLFLGKSDAEQPDLHQWVLLRPSIGLAGNTHDGISKSKLEATLGLELIGYVRYLDDDYSDFWGLSLLSTFGEEAGEGYGVLLRYNNYVLGYTKRDRDAGLGIDDNNKYLFIGFDLYSLVHDKNDKFVNFKRKIRKTIDQVK